MGRFNQDHLQLCHCKLFIFVFSILKYLNILKLTNFGRFKHEHLQLCHWNILFSVFFILSKSLNFERFNPDNLQLCLCKLFIFVFSILKSHNILKLPNFGRYNLNFIHILLLFTRMGIKNSLKDKIRKLLKFEKNGRK